MEKPFDNGQQGTPNTTRGQPGRLPKKLADNWTSLSYEKPD